MIRVFRRWQSLQINVPQHQRSPTRRGRLRCGGHSTAGSILDQNERGSGALKPMAISNSSSSSPGMRAQMGEISRRFVHD